MNLSKIKEGLDLPENTQIRVNKSGKGWTIKIVEPMRCKKTSGKSFRDVMIAAGRDLTRCDRCGRMEYCHPHHVIPKSAGGRDDPDNGVSLCFDCHVGNNGIHNTHAWDISDIVDGDLLAVLIKRYGVR